MERRATAAANPSMEVAAATSVNEGKDVVGGAERLLQLLTHNNHWYEQTQPLIDKSR